MSPLFSVLTNLSVLQINLKNNALVDLMVFSFGLNSVEKSEVHVPFQVLAKSKGYQEVWLSQGKTSYQEGSSYSQFQNDDFLVLEFKPFKGELVELTQNIYQQALDQAKSLDFPELIRTWNYFPRINDEEMDLERYQSFCVARQDVLSQFPEYQQQNPAATAIGTHHEMNSFVFLFAKTPGVTLENKRQMPAWEYPKQYAPKQPRFARAICHSGLLMCSGTASVVGHKTQHVGDLEKQLKESLLNVETLLHQCDKNLSLDAGYYRFYLRQPDQTESVVQYLAQANIKDYVILAADVCRADLLIECEAVFQM